MMKSNVLNKKRYETIDAIRGFAIVNMVLFHFFYDIFVMYQCNSAWYNASTTMFWERTIALSFIIVSGVSFNFTHKPYYNGIILNALGLVITCVTLIFTPNEIIWFGVLNFIGCAIIILELLKKYLIKIPPYLGVIASLLLFAICYKVPSGFIGLFDYKIIKLPNWLYQSDLLAPIGLPSNNFLSADYFPIIPWIFLFSFGYFCWGLIVLHNKQNIFTRKIPVFSFLGKHSLIIYLLHQVIIISVLYFIF